MYNSEKARVDEFGQLLPILKRKYGQKFAQKSWPKWVIHLYVFGCNIRVREKRAILQANRGLKAKYSYVRL